jgi:hypothetical protein
MSIPANQLPQDGQRMIRGLEQVAARWLYVSTKKTAEDYVPLIMEQLADITFDAGSYPVVTSIFVAPRMAQGEESFSEERRQEVQAVHISRMVRMREELLDCINNRPDAVTDYFGKGIDGKAKPQ